MMRSFVQPRDRIFLKGYGFLSFSKNIGKNTGKNTCKSLTGKYSPGMLATRQKFHDHAKQSTTDAFKTASKRAIQKTSEATCNLIGNKIGNKITAVWKNSETVTNDNDKEITREKYISPGNRQEINDDLK